MTNLDYEMTFEVCEISTDPTRLLEIKAACKIILANRLTYWGIERTVNVPWAVIAAIHYRESSFNFKSHLHNGDPLTDRTIRVPAGRPASGSPPFTWTQSAIDALEDRAHPHYWDIGGALEFCERYNGMGYANRGLMSPYIWSSTDQYKSGLFIADGTIDLNRKDPRPGVAALFKALINMGVDLEFDAGFSSQGPVLH